MIKRILIVDDNPDILLLLTQYLALMGSDYQLEACHSGAEALSLGQTRPFDLVISDYAIGNMNGVQLASKLKEQQPELKFILMSGGDGDELAQRAAKAGLSNSISKPFRLSTVYEIVRTVLEA